jgi:hypothetical protein
MSAVNITNVTVLDNPAAFLNPFQFEISYECLTPLKDGTFSYLELRLLSQFDFCIYSYPAVGFGYMDLPFLDFRFGHFSLNKVRIVQRPYCCSPSIL